MTSHHEPVAPEPVIGRSAAMRVAILGAGPAGLYLAYLIKRDLRGVDVHVFEQNAPDATFGFGVVFSERALAFLEDGDAETLAAIKPHLESWTDITLVHRRCATVIDGVGFAAIGRLQLLKILQQRAQSVGVEPSYRRPVACLSDLGGADLIVGADGVNSLVRTAHAAEFRMSVSHSSNHFAWFGTSKRFETLTQTFISNRHGHFNAHHYRYAPAMSTFIVEVDEETFRRNGLAHMSEMQSKAFCEKIFAAALDGHGLIGNRSVWRRFPKVSNGRWFHGNRVLIGDALRTAHFSIGSGTRLAMEDAIALAGALSEHRHDMPAALEAYEAARRPIVEKLVSAADASAAWYAMFAEHMQMSPMDFAMSYITRSGRVSLDQLHQTSPRFAASYEAHRTETVGSGSPP